MLVEKIVVSVLFESLLLGPQFVIYVAVLN